MQLRRAGALGCCAEYQRDGPHRFAHLIDPEDDEFQLFGRSRGGSRGGSRRSNRSNRSNN